MRASAGSGAEEGFPKRTGRALCPPLFSRRLARRKVGVSPRARSISPCRFAGSLEGGDPEAGEADEGQAAWKEQRAREDKRFPARNALDRLAVLPALAPALARSRQGRKHDRLARRPSRRQLLGKGTPMATASLAELDERIAIVRDNIRELTEHAAAFSGAEDETRIADRIADQERRLAELLKERESLLK